MTLASCWGNLKERFFFGILHKPSRQLDRTTMSRSQSTFGVVHSPTSGSAAHVSAGTINIGVVSDQLSVMGMLHFGLRRTLSWPLALMMIMMMKVIVL